jgi:hypothetical protein
MIYILFLLEIEIERRLSHEIFNEILNEKPILL